MESGVGVIGAKETTRARNLKVDKHRDYGARRNRPRLHQNFADIRCGKALTTIYAGQSSAMSIGGSADALTEGASISTLLMIILLHRA